MLGNMTTLFLFVSFLRIGVLLGDLSGDLSCPSEAWKPLCTWKLPESLPVDERQESCAAKNSDYVYETESCEYEPPTGLFCQIDFNAMCFIEQPESGDLTEYYNNCNVPGVEHLSYQCRVAPMQNENTDTNGFGGFAFR